MSATAIRSRRSSLDPTLARGARALPVADFVDPARHALELERVFARNPAYVGHLAMAPEAGDYCVPPAGPHDGVLVHDGSAPRLLSNICRHRQAMLLESRGRLGHIVCPVHGWTYDLQGTLMGAPGMTEAARGCHLGSTPLLPWRGLLFAGAHDPGEAYAGFPALDPCEPARYVFDRAVVDEGAFNWKEFVEVYQDIYHVGPTHPGLSDWVDDGDYELGFGPRWSVQKVGVRDGLRQLRSPAYARYRDALLQHTGGEPPAFGAVWAMLYPNVMLEWYPCALVVSTVAPRGPDRCVNVIEFYYPDEVLAFAPALAAAHREAYLETAREDAANCERLHNGRRALWLAGHDDSGPFHAPHEDCVIHFNDWYRRAMA